MKRFAEFEESLANYNKHKIQVTASKDGGAKEHINVKVFATSEREAKGKARAHLHKKGYETHSAVHQGYDYEWLKKEEVELDEGAFSSGALKPTKEFEKQASKVPSTGIVRGKDSKGVYTAKTVNGKEVSRVYEEVEQIDEISDKTLTSYAQKVSDDSLKHDKDPTKRSAAKRNKSIAGFSRALNKLESRPVKESNDHYEEAEEHKNKASKALETSDMEAHHFHMSNHHEAMGRWHESKGRHSSADREYAKAEEHHEKGIAASKTGRSVKSTNEETQLDELSTDLLARYKEKASLASSAADKAGKYDLGHKRYKGILKATFKQFANDAKKHQK